MHCPGSPRRAQPAPGKPRQPRVGWAQPPGWCAASPPGCSPRQRAQVCRPFGRRSMPVGRSDCRRGWRCAGRRGSIRAAGQTKDLKRAVKALCRAIENRKLASAPFCPCGDRPSAEVVDGLVDGHRRTHGVEPVCAVPQIAPSGCRQPAAKCRHSTLLIPRAQRTIGLPWVEPVRNTDLQVCGADKVRKPMNRADVALARCTAERLVRRLGFAERQARQGGAHHRQQQLGAALA